MLHFNILEPLLIFLLLVASGAALFFFKKASHLKDEKESLAHKYDRLESVLNAVPDAFVWYDEADRLVFHNPQYLSAYPQSAAAIKKGVKFEAILRHGLNHGQYPEALGREEEWLAERLASHRNPDGVIEQKQPDGRWLRIEETRTIHGDHVGFRVDISELKQRETWLEASEERLRATIDTVLDAIIITDDQGIILDFNPAAQDIFGYEREEALGQDMADLVVPDHLRSAHVAGMARLKQTGEPRILKQRLDLIAKHKHGQEFPVEVALSQAEADGKTVYIGTIRDMTSHKATTSALEEAKAEAERASLAKSEFLANMSHEIRNPLNGLLGMTRLLADTQLSGDQHRLLKTIEKSGYELLEIMNDLLDFSKLEAGELQLDHGPVHLESLIEDSIDLFWANARQKSLFLGYSASDNCPNFIMGDASRIRQILNNLIGNAIKFTQIGDIMVSLALGEARENRKMIVLTVQDTGVGIAADKIESLFNRYEQAHSSDSQKQRGVGLGLAISKQLIEAMKGTLSVSSVVGEGSQFTVMLPVEEPNSDDYQIQRDLGLNAAFFDTHVILIDGHETSASMLDHFLEKHVGAVTRLSAQEDSLPFADIHQQCETRYLVIINSIETLNTNLVQAINDARETLSDRLKIIAIKGLAEKEFSQLSSDYELNRPVHRRNLLHTVSKALKDPKRLPSKKADTSSDKNQSALEQDNQAGLSILVADDNQTNRELTRLFLEKLGHTAECCGDGVEAVMLVAQHHYDLVLMDAQMPLLDGIEATRQIHETSIKKQPPIIAALTANALPQFEKECREAGMKAIVTKPITIEALKATIETLFPAKNINVQAAQKEVDQANEVAPNSKPTDLLDPGKINMLRETLPVEKFDVILSVFLKELDDLADTLDANRDNPAQLEAYAHQLKGASANLGAIVISDKALELEQSALKASRQANDALVDQIMTLSLNTQIAIRAHTSL